MPIFPRHVLLILLGAVTLLAGVHAAPAQPAAPAVRPEGLTQATGFMDRMVRITSRRRIGQTDGATQTETGGASGYGIIVGEHPTSNGEPGFVVVTADHLVRDPTQPNAEFDPPRVTYYANLAVTVPAEIQPQRLTPTQGNLAVLVVPRDASWHVGTNFMGNPTGLQPGTLAWRLGKPGVWQPDTAPGRFAFRDPAGWLMFDGLDTPKGSAGAAVVINRGLIGMVTEDGTPPSAATRVLPVDVMAQALRGWNLEWDIGARDAVAPGQPGTPGAAVPRLSNLAQPALPGLGSLSTGAMPAPAPSAPDARPAQRPAGLSGGDQTAAARPAPANPLSNLAPVQIIPLLPAELASRSSWVPQDAKVSPWIQSSAPLFSAPKRDATPVGSMPPGNQLPFTLWVNGAYDIVRKLDNGAWFLVANEDQQIGYVSGTDVVEVWPSLTRDGTPGGRLVREWTSADGGRASLRDLATSYEIAVTVKCAQAFCDSILVYTPRPPTPGWIVPTFQIRAIAGRWRQDESATIRILVPRAVVEAKGAQLLACIGQGANCREQKLLPAS